VRASSAKVKFCNPALSKVLAHFNFLQKIILFGRYLPLHNHTIPAMLCGKGVEKIVKLCNPGQKFGTLHFFATNGLSWFSPPSPQP